jgi:uncharacterized protein (TIGR02246 family)
MRRILLGTILIAAFSSLAYGQSASANTRKAIEANLKTFVAAFNRGDAAAVAALYAVDAKLLPPNGPIVEGRANIQTFWAGGISAGLKIVSLTATDVNVAGNLAIETGKYVSTVPAGGGTTTDEGKYVVVWRREGRAWKIIRDVFNSDKPAQ